MIVQRWHRQFGFAIALLAIAISLGTALNTTAVSGMAGSFTVTGRGISGNETLLVKVNSSTVDTVNLTTTSATYSIDVATGTDWADLELVFNDSPGHDAIVTGFSLHGEARSMVAGDVLVSGQWTGSTCSTIGPPIGQTIHCNGIIQFPAGAPPFEPPDGTLDPSYWGNAQTVVPVYDTAWDMGVQTNLAQAAEYMDFVVDAGFSGFATTYLGNVHAPATPVNPQYQNSYVHKDPLGNSIASSQNGQLIMDPGHADHFEDILDLADQRGLRVMLLVVWERKTVEQYHLLDETNAYHWANQVGARFKDHPAIQAWTLGGDAGTDAPRTQFWTNVSNGLRDAGVTGDLNFHTGASPARRVNQIDAPWNTGQLIMTSHCADTALATSRLQTVLAQSDIPVWVGEPRYEGIVPSWCAANPYVPTAQDIVDDALSFVNAGAAGLFYGHNERWQWGHGLEGSMGGGWPTVQQSFSAPGAYALIDALTVDAPDVPDVSINEVRFAPGDGRAEFVEIRNNEAQAVDISGWQVDRFHTVPSGTMLAAGELYVVASDTDDFLLEFPGAPAPNAQYSSTVWLANSGERIDLSTSTGDLVDEAEYAVGGGWPSAGMLGAGSIERVVGAEDGAAPTSWAVSALGTPGSANGEVLCGGFAITVDLSQGQSATTGADVVLGTSQTDLVIAMGGDDVICGMGGADEIYGGNGSDLILGGGGQDLISGQGDADVLFGGWGQDRVNGGNGPDVVSGGPGLDLLRGQGGSDLVVGGAGVDEIFGGSGDDEIHTGAGGNRTTSSVVSGGGNDDIIYGGPGDDHLLGISGIDELFGGEGNDLLSGGNGRDTLDGGPGNDQLAGGASRDLLFGGDGNDLINAGTGDDDLFGQAGDDVLNGQAGTDLCTGGTTEQSAGDSASGCETTVSIP